MKQQTNNSKRQLKRANRDYNSSRCNRRAEQRLNRTTRGYREANCFSAYTTPGAMKRW